jgi:phosphatidylserine/phosphatidylglycerophosphate/cardiolipin synthase-like enzyme
MTLDITRLRFPAFLSDVISADLLFDQDYIAFVRASLISARKRILALQFVIDARPETDTNAEVRYVLHALADAASRGLDVRAVLAPVLAERPFLIDINEPAAQFLGHRGVPVRRYPHTSNSQMHAKMLAIDDKLLICGSHNWTPGSFRINSETSIVVNSPTCAAVVGAEFDKLWQLSEEYPA